MLAIPLVLLLSLTISLALSRSLLDLLFYALGTTSKRAPAPAPETPAVAIGAPAVEPAAVGAAL